MEINNINIPYIRDLSIGSKEISLEEGDIVKGEILDVESEEALIDIKGFGKIRANIQMELGRLIGKEVDFLIKSKTIEEIQLKPILNFVDKTETLEISNSKTSYLIEILNQYGIEEDFVSMEYLKDLMEYNVPINEKNIVSGIKTLKRLEQLMDLDEDIHTILNLEKDTEIENADIRNIIIISKESDEENKTNLNSPIERTIAEIEEIKEIVEKTNINKDNIKLESKENKIQNTDEISIKDLKSKLNIDSNIIKTTALFVKHDIKASINNIKYFLELNETKDGFLKDLELLQKDFKYEKFTISDKKAMINSVSYKNIIEENHMQYKILLKETKEYIDDNLDSMDKETKGRIEELENKLNFLDEMNQELNLIYLPMFLNNNYDNAITLLKEKRNKEDFKDKINVFINLNTNNLGNIKIFCQSLGNILNIKFNGISEEDIKLFENKEKELEIVLLNIGYTLGNIEYDMGEENNILDSLTVNKNPVYYLDVEV